MAIEYHELFAFCYHQAGCKYARYSRWAKNYYCAAGHHHQDIKHCDDYVCIGVEYRDDED